MTNPSDTGDDPPAAHTDEENQDHEQADSPEPPVEDLPVDEPGQLPAEDDDEMPPRPDIVPESPDPENVVFVLVGVVIALFVVYRAVVIFGGG